MKQTLSRVKQPNKFDFILLSILTLIFISSIIAIYSAFPQIPAYVNGPDLLNKQIMFYILGFVIILIIMYLGNDNLYDFAKLGYKIMMGMLIYLLISMVIFKYLGMNHLPFVNYVNGATSWFDFPLIGTFQPSEFMKIILIVLSAYIIRDHNEDKSDDSFESDISLFIRIGKIIIPPMILIFLQPDTGICIIIGFSILLMLICSGIRREWIIAGVIVILIGLLIFFYIYYYDPTLFKKIAGDDYKYSRIYGWLETEKYANGSGHQLYSSLLAIGSSGWFGQGIQSTAITIPEPQTDMIFAVIGLCFGYIGCIFVIGLCLALDIRLGLIAYRTKNIVEKLMITGFLGMLIFQQIQNIGMVTGLLPITGITLPLISAGGSSLLSYMMAFGIIMNASIKAKKLSDFIYD